jgi:hypothetical protein
VEGAQKIPNSSPIAAKFSRMKGEDAAIKRYGVFAKDGRDKQATSQTEKFLQQLVGAQNVNPPQIRSSTDTLEFWACNSESSSPILRLGRQMLGMAAFQLMRLTNLIFCSDGLTKRRGCQKSWGCNC